MREPFSNRHRSGGKAVPAFHITKPGEREYFPGKVTLPRRAATGYTMIVEDE
jgi:hypothetical protein